MTLPHPRPMAERGPVDADAFAAIRKQGTPVVLRGQVTDWPMVAAARAGDHAVVDYLKGFAPQRPVVALFGETYGTGHGRFFYNADMTGFNFDKGQGQLGDFLDHLIGAANDPDAPSTAVQSEPVAELLPGFTAANPMPLLAGVAPRMWLGNRIRVAPHFDLQENIACCAAGRRRFTLFPPDQIANLYPGPMELTPAGTPVSMVDPLAPDLSRYPRYAEAAKTALSAVLEPGDALYIPYCWWHGVEALDPVSILVNYWWVEGRPEGLGGPYDALLHALLAYRHLPEAHRSLWRGMLDYYVFEDAGDPAAHLPDHAKGVLGPPSPSLFARMRQIIREAVR